MPLTGERFDSINLMISWGGTTINEELCRSFSWTVARDMHDMTGGGESARRKFGGRRDYTGTLELYKSDADADDLTVFDETQSAVAALVVYPNGDSSGEMTRSGNAWITNISETNPIGEDMAVLSISIDFDGAVTKGTVSGS